MPAARPTLALVLCAIAAAAHGQEGTPPPAPTAQTAAELLERLREAGVALPEGMIVNEDGSVTLPAPPPTRAVEFIDEDGQPVPPPEAAAADEPPAQTDPDPEAQPAAPEKSVEWQNQIVASAGVNQGNTETANFNLTYRGLRETVRSRLTLDAGYFFSSEDGEAVSSKATVGAQHDWLLQESPWLYFVAGRYDFDDFNSFLHRVNVNGGVGYEFFRQKDDIDLIVRGGAGVTREFGSERTELIAELVFGADFNWQITENQSFEASTRVFPELTEVGEFRSLTTAAYVIQIDRDNALAINFGVRHEYLSEVDPGVEQNDLRLFAGLQYDF